MCSIESRTMSTSELPGESFQYTLLGCEAMGEQGSMLAGSLFFYLKADFMSALNIRIQFN